MTSENICSNCGQIKKEHIYQKVGKSFCKKFQPKSPKENDFKIVEARLKDDIKRGRNKLKLGVI